MKVICAFLVGFLGLQSKLLNEMGITWFWPPLAHVLISIPIRDSCFAWCVASKDIHHIGPRANQ